MASESMDGARDVVWETGRPSALRGSGNRFTEAFTEEETSRWTWKRTDSELGQPGSRGVHTTNS